jgi:hypothetical protein
MTSSNPNSNPNANANTGPTFRPFAVNRKGSVKFIPANSVGLVKPAISQALQTGGDQIQVTWGDGGGETYRLQVSTNGGTSFSDVTTTSGLSFTHTGLSFPGSYTYRVRAELGGEVSDYSDNVTETMVDVPAAPGGLAVTGATTSSISLSWNDTADESSYLVEVSPDGLGSWTTAGTTAQNVVTFTHSGLAESVQRYYRVVAVNKAGGSLPSSSDNTWTVPATPTGFTATATSSTQIDLIWTDVSTGNTSYKVERSTDNTNWTEIATGLSATATTYSATGLSGSTLYYFRVRAANAARNSAYSGTASATTTAAIPAAPTGFTATSSFADSVSLAWTDASTNETGFDIEVSTNAGSTYSSVTTTAANAVSYSHTGRLESTAYLYRIRATNSAGSSSWVVASSVTTPAAIQSFTATAASSSSINLSWVDKSQVETGFRIEYSEDNFNWSLLTTTASSATSFTNTNLNPSTTYYYRIRSNSYNGTNNSAWYTASATTQAAAGIPAATYDMDFTTDPYVGAGGRFSRASRGTFVNSSGFIQVAEMNLQIYSEELNNTTGWNQLIGATVTANTATAPDNNTTADTLVENTTTGTHRVNSVNATVTANTTRTASFYVKPLNRNFCAITLYCTGGTGSRFCQVFDLTGSGSLGGTATFSAPTNTSGTITPAGNGWFRITATMQSSDTTCSVAICGSNSATPTYASQSPSYTGNGLGAIYVWGAQLVSGSSALPYVRTTTAAVGTPRITHDPVTLAPLGLLLEPAATNGLLRSEDWSTVWTLAGITQTASAATSPDGTANATRLVEQSVTQSHETYQSRTAGNSVSSVYMKADQRTAASITLYRATNNWVTCTFNLSAGTAGTVASGSASTFTSAQSGIENAGNGWYRCWVAANNTSDTTFTGISLNTTATPTRQAANGVESYAGNTANGIFVWGAQSEATNAPPTSYIPTVAATVTRSADGWNLQPTDMSSIWNQSQGSLVASGRAYTPFSNGGFARVGVAGTTLNNGYYTSMVSTAGRRPSIRVAGSGAFSGPTGSPNSGEYYKSGFSYNQATPAFTGFVNGTAGTAQSLSTSAATLDKMELGTRQENNMTHSTSIGTVFSPYIVERMRYWNTALSNADMGTLTSTAPYNVEALVIAGGGSGGGYGGGGAGGYKTSTGLSLTVGNVVTVTVGGGGAGNTQTGNNGNNSSLSGTGISTITSTGGGGGGGLASGSPFRPGQNGGSGGGGGTFNANNTAGGTGTSGEGNDGGAGQVNANYPGGGGGGADAVGGAGVLVGSTATGGAGGAGKASSITGSSVTRAGGGGGGAWNNQSSSTGGAGGSGGGGSGGDDLGGGTAGSANEGGGGGGQGDGGFTVGGGAGGSGVVILRMATANYSGTTTGSPSVTTSGSDTILTFNASGSYTA